MVTGSPSASHYGLAAAACLTRDVTTQTVLDNPSAQVKITLPQIFCDTVPMTPPAEQSGPRVLLAFRARNVRSFRDDLELSLLATRLAEKGVPRPVMWNEGGGSVDVLPVAALYGGNASGKTNVLRAMFDMHQLVRHSFRLGDANSGLPRAPFRLDPTSAKSPSRFEVEIILHGVRHAYGFAVDDTRVHEEWAYRWPKGRRALIFRRNGDDFDFGPGSQSKNRAVLEIVRPNSLFLSAAGAANHPVLSPLHAWFSRNLRYAEERSRAGRQARTCQLLEDPKRRDQVLDLLRVADLGVIGAEVLELDPQLAERIRKALRIMAGEDNAESADEVSPPRVLEAIRLSHASSTEPVLLDPSEESLGTLVWLGLIGPVIDALVDGAVLLADELDASLHPALVTQLIRLFQNPETNPNRAQLVCNVHDVSLLGDSTSERVLGRDQIWFTDKLADGSTRLRPLSDHDPRVQEAVARRYLDGRYGGTPILSPEEFVAAAERILQSSDAS